MRLLRAAFAVLALALVLGEVWGTDAAGAASVPVVRCPTTFGADYAKPAKPATVEVLHRPSSVRGLVAYWNTDIFLIAPAGMNCSGGVGVDGTTNITVWPHGSSEAGRTQSITMEYDSGCSGCRAGIACPFFVAFAVTMGIPCTADVPAHEGVYRSSAGTVLFEDPPGVRGSGDRSGGRYPANGFVEIGRGQVVTRETCTLPAAQHAVCTVSLNDAIARYS